MKRAPLLLALGLVVSVSLIPFPRRDVPRCEVKVVDHDGNPLSDTQVVERWTYFGDPGDFMDYAKTNGAGLAYFPERTQKISGFYLARAMILGPREKPHAGLIAFRRGYGRMGADAAAGWPHLAGDEPQFMTIRLSKCPELRHGVNCALTDEQWAVAEE